MASRRCRPWPTSCATSCTARSRAELEQRRLFDASTGNGALNGKGFADAAFTEQRLKELLAGARDFSVLHIGTHFRLRPGNALRSFLLLGDGSNSRSTR